MFNWRDLPFYYVYGYKIFVLTKRFSKMKDRFIRLFAFPTNLDRRDEWFVIFAQFIAFLWIILGIVLKATSLETFLAEIPLGRLVGFTILLLPILVFIMILRWLSSKK